MTEIGNRSSRSKATTGDATKKGVHIERIYTTPGVHPYDEVTWEKRDVVQQNWEDRRDDLRAARRRLPRLLVGQREHHRHHEVLPWRPGYRQA